MLIPVVYRHRRFGHKCYGFLDELPGRYTARPSPQAAEDALRSGILDWKPLGQLDTWSWEMIRLERTEG